MKSNIMIAALGMLLAGPAFAQQKGKVSEEVIIKKNGDGQEKTTIVIDGDRITVNGKPIAEYNGNNIVIRKKEIEGLQREMEMYQHEMMDAQREMQRAQREYRRSAPRAYRYNYGPDQEFDFQFNIENDVRERVKINSTPKAFLGVGMEKADKGVKITNVSEGSAAAKAGLKTGDRITKFGTIGTTSPEQLTELVRSKKPGDEVELTYVRTGEKKEKKVKVKLGETKSPVMAFELNEMELLAPMAPGAPRPPRPPRSSRTPEAELWSPMPPMPHMSPISPMPMLPGNWEGFHWEGSRPSLGLRIQDTDESNGVKVLDVTDGSLALTAGVKENDIITEINGKAVKNTDEAREAINDVKDKTSYPVKLMRNGAPLTLEVKVPKKLKKTDL